MASTYLSRTLGTSTNTYKGTVSVWLKRSGQGSDQVIYGNYTSGTQRGKLVIAGDGKLLYYQNDGGAVTIQLETNRLFRDVGAFYHIVLSVDTTQATASDRVKLYVNGTQETSFSIATYPSQNAVFYLNANSVLNYIGQEGNSSDYWDGLMSYFSVVDGTAYDASYFGETDSSSGIWKIKTSPSVTWGNNGFFLKMDTSSPGTDTSGNNNTFTASGTPTLTQDNASNVFATWNTIMNNAEDGNWSNGNTTIAPNGDATYLYAPTTIGVSSGKWYSEHMITGGNGYGMLGAISEDNIVDGFRQQTGLGTLTNSFGFRCRDGEMRMNSTNTAYGSAPGTSDAILGMALDMDNKKVYYSINGVWQNSGNPSTGTNGFDFSSLTGDTFLITIGDDTSAGYGNFKSNFGNGFFATTAVTSSNADAAGYGLMEYAVPTGYYTLCTKNLNTYG